MEKFEHNAVVYYKFDIFKPYPRLRHAIFTRSGGVSGPQGLDLNLAFCQEDPLTNVQTNLQRAVKAIGVPWPAFGKQTHGCRVLPVTAEEGYQPKTPEEVKQNYDALLAPRPGPSLLIKMADCQGVTLFDPATGALSLIHSGWRGSVQNIIGAAVKEMSLATQTSPAGFLAAISPSLGPCCAEFTNYRQELPQNFWPFMTAKANHFDFWAISRSQLTEAGLNPAHIETAGICTKCSPEFFSYHNGDKWGRFGVIAQVARD